MRPVIDWDQLESLRALQEPDEPDLLEGLIASFVRDAGPRMARLGTAVSARDLVAARFEAHTLKGSAAQLGAVVLSQAAEQLEHAAFNGAIDRLPALAEHLTRSMEDVLAALASPPFRGGCPI